MHLPHLPPRLAMKLKASTVIIAVVTGLVTVLVQAPASAAVTGSHLAVSGFGTNQGWQVSRHPRFLADITGDLRADIVGFGDAGVYTAVSNGDGTFQPGQFVVANLGFDQGWRIDLHPRWVADITGDERADIVGIGDAGVWTAVSRGDGSFEPVTFVLQAFGASDRTVVTKFFLVDTNADGMADIVSIANNHMMFISTATGGGGFAPPRLASTAFDFVNFDFSSFQAIDVTGDRRAEILAIQAVGPIRLVSSSPIGNGFYSAPVPAGAHFPNGEVTTLRTIGDITGDGRNDLVQFDTLNPGTFSARSNGNGTFSDFVQATPDFGSNQAWQPTRHPRLVADITADESADLVAFGDAGIYTAVSQEDGTFATPGRFVLAEFGYNDGWRIESHPRMLADITGDRKADVVAFGDAAVYTAIATGDGGFGESELTAVPDLFGNSAPQAVAALSAAGLGGTRSTAFDPTCEFIGLVLWQNPPAGTLVRRGSSVSFAIGRASPSCW